MRTLLMLLLSGPALAQETHPEPPPLTHANCQPLLMVARLNTALGWCLKDMVQSPRIGPNGPFVPSDAADRAAALRAAPWPATATVTDQPLGNLLWERQDVLFAGDRVRLQGRSRPRLEWQLGGSDRQVQWNLVAQPRGGADQARELVRLQATRRF